MKRIVLIILSLLILDSCKKDKNISPAFSAPGYWRGNLSIDPTVVVGIVNKPNGTSRYYLLSRNLDTATAPLKYDGTYTVDKDIFHAEYRFDSTNFTDHLSLETTRTASNSMEGVIVQYGLSDGTSFAGTYNFDVIKQ